MSDVAIRAENIGKLYRIGERERYLALRDVLARTLSSPARLFGRKASGSESSQLWAVKDISFEIRKGEVVGIIGGNGAGKSTLLKILARVTRPTRGFADIHGRMGTLLEVGTGFHPELTGRENVFLSGAILGMKKAEIQRNFDEIVAFSEVEKFIDTPVKHYSSGMYMRLAFAVAAHLEPEILVVDEVLAVGDAQFQKKCLGKLGDISRGGRTVLFVSHNMAAMRNLCDRLIWLASGSLVCDGEPGKVIGRYLANYSATALDRIWPEDEAPKNAGGYLRRVRLLAKDEEHIDTNTPVDLEFEYVNQIAGTVLNFSVLLNNTEGVCIFNSTSPARPTPEGVLRGRCSVPGGFLNDGHYLIRILVVKDTSVILCEQADALAFEVHDAPREGSWFGKWGGVVRPVLPWTMSTDRQPTTADAVQSDASLLAL